MGGAREGSGAARDGGETVSWPLFQGKEIAVGKGVLDLTDDANISRIVAGRRAVSRQLYACLQQHSTWSRSCGVGQYGCHTTRAVLRS